VPEALILASSSARRRALLEQIGVPFQVTPARIDEPLPRRSEAPGPFAIRAAHAKWRDVARRRAGTCLGADTIVVIDGRILGKPTDDRHAASMLADLAGRSHRVVTAMALSAPDQGAVPPGWQAREGCWTIAVTTAVRFRALEPAEIARYVATGEPRGKAGAYAIQGIGGGLVASIEGSYTNVVGLPVAVLLEGLRTRLVWPVGGGEKAKWRTATR